MQQVWSNLFVIPDVTTYQLKGICNRKSFINIDLLSVTTCQIKGICNKVV